MEIWKLLAVSAAYGVLLAFCLGGSPQFALGASFAPIAAVLWGKKLYRRIQDNDKFIDFGLSALLLLHIGIPFVIAAPINAILRGITSYTEFELVTPVCVLTIMFEWLVYGFIWVLQANAFQSQQMKMRQAQSVSAKNEQEAAERRAYLLSEQEKERQAAQRTRQQAELVRSQHEHEQEFYRLREKRLDCF
jgi:hypothetical protein